MIFARLADEGDHEPIKAMVAACLRETKPFEPWDDEVLDRTWFRYIDGGNPIFYVAEQHRKAIGFLMATVNEFDYRTGFYTAQRLLYVQPEKRGTRAAAILMQHFVAESDRMGATEIMGGNDNGFQSERTARFLEHFGFQRVGFAMRKPLE